MVSLTLKVILHVEENDSKYRDIAPLTLGVFNRENSVLTLFVFVFVCVYSSPDSAVQPPVSPSVLAKTPKKVPAVWKGFVMMQSVAKFGTSAYRVSGPCDDLLQLLPDTLHVQGRIAHEQVWDYLLQLKSSTSRVRVVEVIFQKRVRVFRRGFQIRGNR